MNEMTIDEAIYCMKSYLPEADSAEHCTKCPYYGVERWKGIKICRSSTAHKMAIEALTKYRSQIALNK